MQQKRIETEWELPPLRVLEGRDPDQVLRITLQGELDLSVCGQLSMRLEQLRRDGAPVRLDLSGVEFIDSSGIHMLVTAMNNASAGGKRLFEVVPEVSLSVSKMIELTGIQLIVWPKRECAG